MHLAPGGASYCDYGSSVEQSDCDAAVQSLATRFGKSIGGSLAVGSGGSCLDGGWGSVPLGCSAQSLNRGLRAVYKTGGGDQSKGCANEMYQLVCSDSGIIDIIVFIYCIILIL